MIDRGPLGSAGSRRSVTATLGETVGPTRMNWIGSHRGRETRSSRSTPVRWRSPMTVTEAEPGELSVATSDKASRSASVRSPRLEVGWRSFSRSRIREGGPKLESTSGRSPIPISAARSLSVKEARMRRASANAAGQRGLPASMARRLRDRSSTRITSWCLGRGVPPQPSGR